MGWGAVIIADLFILIWSAREKLIVFSSAPTFDPTRPQETVPTVITQRALVKLNA